jgi:formylglycine-generating enzyme required for sulfatase activity
MGSTKAEVAKLLEEAKSTKLSDWYIQRLPTEAPKHPVRITSPFYVGVCEVTQAEYERVTGSNPSRFKDDPSRPVEMVTWDEGSAFCRKLGELPQERAADAEYRLPTEAESEYACRAGTTTAWYCGDDEGALQEYAWFNVNSGLKPHPVGQKSPNAWGLRDMHGNVWEWCQDWFGDRDYATSPRDDPTGASGGSHRVYRGGGWRDGASCCRASYRDRGGPGFRHEELGFRLARPVSSSASQ